MLLLTASSPAKSLLSPPFFSHHSPLYFSRFNVLASPPRRLTLLPHLRIRSFQHEDAENYETAKSVDTPDGQDKEINDLLVPRVKTATGPGNSFLAKLAIALGIAATITLLSIYLKQPGQGPSLGIQYLVKDSSSSTLDANNVFTFKAFGYRVMLPQSAPGWVYFWLLMAAGFGLFISEEALNIWVGISLARRLTLDGTWLSFAESFTRNASYIASTVLWVYWGVCISDMVPFYIGKFFRTSGTTNDVCSKLGIGKEKAVSITRNVQKYGNLIGFGHISRVFLCWCLLWWVDYSSAPVGDWILIARASSFCCCNRGDRSGYMDFSPICCSGFNSIVLISPTALLQLIFLHDLVHSSRTRNCIKSILLNTQKLHKIDPAKHPETA